MKEKYRFLLKIKSLEFEIKELLYTCSIDGSCFELLKEKLNYLCSFIVDKEAEDNWFVWGNDYEVVHSVRNLRYISCKALCNLEKYQANCLKFNLEDEFRYTRTLEKKVLVESKKLGINKDSKVVFIGSGAMPISAFAIAESIGSEIRCIDIDNEAIELSSEISKLLKLDDLITFSKDSLNDLDYLKEASHIIIASLVEDKMKIVKEIKDYLNKEAKIVLRYGNGIKSVFNYPLDTCSISGWKLNELNDRESIYETIVLEK